MQCWPSDIYVYDRRLKTTRIAISCYTKYAKNDLHRIFWCIVALYGDEKLSVIQFYFHLFFSFLIALWTLKTIIAFSNFIFTFFFIIIFLFSEKTYSFEIHATAFVKLSLSARKERARSTRATCFLCGKGILSFAKLGKRVNFFFLSQQCLFFSSPNNF